MLYLTERHHSLVLIWLVFILVVLFGTLAYQQISAQIIVSPQLKLDYSSEEAYGEWTAAHGHCLRASGRWPPGGLIGKDVWHLQWDDCKKRLKGTPVLVPDPRRPPALLLLVTVQACTAPSFRVCPCMPHRSLSVRARKPAPRLCFPRPPKCAPAVARIRFGCTPRRGKEGACRGGERP